MSRTLREIKVLSHIPKQRQFDVMKKEIWGLSYWITCGTFRGYINVRRLDQAGGQDRGLGTGDQTSPITESRLTAA